LIRGGREAPATASSVNLKISPMALLIVVTDDFRSLAEAFVAVVFGRFSAHHP
jgi:hypothetical protein